jgi:hypothetical protein
MIKNIKKIFEEELKKISIEFNLDYEELEKLYLNNFNDIIKNINK